MGRALSSSRIRSPRSTSPTRTALPPPPPHFRPPRVSAAAALVSAQALDDFRAAADLDPATRKLFALGRCRSWASSSCSPDSWSCSSTSWSSSPCSSPPSSNP
ncbi:unnamed protein product [Urochloa humidicola]